MLNLTPWQGPNSFSTQINYSKSCISWYSKKQLFFLVYELIKIPLVKTKKTFPFFKWPLKIQLTTQFFNRPPIDQYWPLLEYWLWRFRPPNLAASPSPNFYPINWQDSSYHSVWSENSFQSCIVIQVSLIRVKVNIPKLFKLINKLNCRNPLISFIYRQSGNIVDPDQLAFKKPLFSKQDVSEFSMVMVKLSEHLGQMCNFVVRVNPLYNTGNP